MIPKIIPSLLVQTETEFLTQLKGLADSVDMIQIDIADGQFVSNKTWADPLIVKAALPFSCELHLMVQNPLEEMKKWEAVPQVKRVLIHIESVPNFPEIIRDTQAYPWEVGLVLNPETPLATIDPYLTLIDEIMFMGVHPGRQGQAMLPETVDRIKEFKKRDTEHPIAVDGGVNLQTIPLLQKAGVDILCPGSAIFGNEHSPEENVRRIRTLLSEKA